ncbi:probable protein phosphatase 2C 62 isoform X2 [Impatiens glandulifera]|uniref:probable protein phosphatase 2C 62 isoform X2 n=1 Tax=Impatiens glandulifera TaxID=253017 RepID=UPI001FB09C05|nr:probable protein phosphatase 2C 62 isoform X2 [Impatiens glandulifera]
MAEFFHTLIDSRSFNALSLLIPCPSPSKSFSTLPVHSPRTLTRIRRSSRNRFAVSAKSTSSSSALDVISTSENSDGSILFRFGDPSEVSRRIREESDKKLNSLKVLDGEQEKHVTRDASTISANDVTETTHEREVPASEVVDIETNGSSGSEDHQCVSASAVCNSSSTEVVLGLQVNEEQSAVVNDLDDLTVAHDDVPQLDENGNTEKGGSALQEILQEGSKGESAPSLNKSSVLISELPSGSAGESSINHNDTTKVHQSEDLVVDANLNFDNEEAVGLSNIIQVAPESKVVGTESVLDQEVRGGMPGELLDTKELLLSQPILVEEVSHEPEGVQVAPESKVDGTESMLDQVVRGDMPGELLDKKELLLSQPILVEEISHEPEGVVVGAESVLDREVSHEPEGVVLVAQSVLDQEVSGDMPGELLDTNELLSQPILVEEVIHEPKAIEVAPESKVVGAESEFDQEASSDIPEELLGTKELLSQPILLLDMEELPSQPILVEEVIHEPKAIEVAPEFKVVGAESQFDQEVSSDIPEELLDTKELLSQPILVEEVSHEPEGSLETKEYEQSQIYVTAANETADVQNNGSTRPMDAAEFVKTEETDLVESLGYGLFKRETVDTHFSEQTNDLIAPAETETEETDFPGENNNLVESSEQTTISREKMPREAYVIHCGVSLFPHPKALTGGEDAYFLAGSWFGVADGVSDWSIEGTSPVDVIKRSVNESASRGLSTILVAHFDGQVLRVANIGDSRIIVIRNNSIYKRSLPMHHEFNFPLLIGNGDNPFKFVEEDMIELDDGDVVITATDGLFDNVYEEEIKSIISKSLQAQSKPQEIAEILALRAQEVGKSVTCRSPFADEARAAGYEKYAGGKLDDVTVIVSLVKTNIS